MHRPDQGGRPLQLEPTVAHPFGSEKIDILIRMWLPMFASGREAVCMLSTGVSSA